MTTVPTPKHYWKFDESSGNIAKDSTGGADITLDRDDCWVTGKFGNAVRFDPSGGVKTATAFQLETSEIPQPWTASFWVQRGDAGKPASLFSSDKYALRLQQVDALDKAGITIFHQADKHFDLGIPTGTWTHLTMVGTANDTKLYVNGELKATLTTPINLGMHWLGSTHGHQDYAVALLDEVKVWDVALTGDQVKEVSNENTDQAVNPPPPSAIQPIIPLDSGIATTINSRHDIKDAIAQRVLWCFWTGDNLMSDQRRRCLESMGPSTECNVVLVTKENLGEFTHPDHPLHPGYEFLSDTHRADYLRTYFSHIYGGGYSDIKFQRGSWLSSFEALEARPEMFAIGYKEYSYGVPAYLNTAAGVPLSNFWEMLIGNGAYIFRSRTDFTEEWFRGLRQVMDVKLESLRQNPSRFPQDTTGVVYEGVESGYPLSWSEVLGDIFHPVCYKYSDKLLNTLPPPIFNDYR